MNQIHNPLRTRSNVISLLLAACLLSLSAVIPVQASQAGSGAAAPGSFQKVSPANAATYQDPAPGVKLIWSVSSGATGYEWCVDTSNNNVCNTNWFATGTGTNTLVLGLQMNTTYYWHVRAVNGGGTTNSDGGWWHFTTTSAPGAFGKSGPADLAVDAHADIAGLADILEDFMVFAFAVLDDRRQDHDP
jgi:hypothetical protein